MKKTEKTGKSKKEANQRKNYNYIWLALVFLFFAWLPIINVVLMLPASMYFSSNAIIRSRKYPEIYGGLWIAVILLIVAAITFIFSFFVLINPRYIESVLNR